MSFNDVLDFVCLVAAVVLLAICGGCATKQDNLCEFHQKNPDMSLFRYQLGEACEQGQKEACELLGALNVTR